MNEVLVSIPAYNEEANIGRVAEGLVRNHNSVLILDAHQQLEDVQGVRPQVFLDEGLGSDFGGVQTKLLRQDGLYFFKHKIRFRCPVGPGMTF